jgi:Flp pilus assembly protein TadD
MTRANRASWKSALAVILVGLLGAGAALGAPSPSLAPPIQSGTGAPGKPTAEKSAAAYIRAGDMAMEAGEPMSAVEFYRRATTLTPKDPLPVTKLGGALEAAGEYTQAYEILSKAHAQDPSAWRVDLALGRLAIRLDRPQLALASLDEAMRLHEDPAIWGAMGVAHDELGDHVRAQADYKTGLEKAPSNLVMKNNLGLSQALSGDYAAAIRTLTSLVAEPGATARHRLNLALVYGLAGEDDKAAQAARRDLGESDGAANRKAYAVLRAMDDKTRTRAILGIGPEAVAQPVKTTLR